MRKQIWIILFLLGCIPAFGQQKDVNKLFAGKRWALAYYIEKYDNRSDTVLRVHDCQNEFLEVYANGTFLSSNLKKEGKWSFKNDSLLVLTRFSGAKYKEVVVNYLSEDSLAITDRENPKNIFIETYNRCHSNDTTYTDSREIFTVRSSWGIMTGYQQFKNGFIELGLARGKFEWNNAFYGFGGTIEASPWTKTYGLSANVWTENIFVFGLGASSYTDFKNTAFGVKPILGFSAKELFKSDFTLHIAYSYLLLVGNVDKEFDTFNRHAITLRMYLPFKKSTQTTRKIVKKGVDY